MCPPGLSNRLKSDGSGEYVEKLPADRRDEDPAACAFRSGRAEALPGQFGSGGIDPDRKGRGGIDVARVAAGDQPCLRELGPEIQQLVRVEIQGEGLQLAVLVAPVAAVRLEPERVGVAAVPGQAAELDAEGVDRGVVALDLRDQRTHLGRADQVAPRQHPADQQGGDDQYDGNLNEREAGAPGGVHVPGIARPSPNAQAERGGDAGAPGVIGPVISCAAAPPAAAGGPYPRGGAGGRARTGTPLGAQHFKCCASTSSATPARGPAIAC